MPQFLADPNPRLATNDHSLAKTMAEASYQVGIYAGDITGHIEDITKRIADQTELLSAITVETEEMTNANAGIAVSAQALRSEANTITDRMSEAQAAIKQALNDALAFAGDKDRLAANLPALRDALGRINRASRKFDEVAFLRESLVQRVTSIADSTAKNRELCEYIFEELAQVNEAEQATRTDSENVSGMCMHLSDLSAELYYTIVASGVKTADTPFIEAVMDTARQVTEAIENAVDQGEIGLETLFDENYVQMPDIQPPKYTTRWLPLIEKLVPPICEPVSTITPEVVLCTVTDRNGYMPVNNLRWSHPPTDDPVWNATYSRQRIRHRDRISLRISQSTKPFLVMVFRRQLGDRVQVLRDVSAPVIIKGRLWGNVRMLILIKTETIDYILKQMDIHRAIAKVRAIEAERPDEEDEDQGMVLEEAAFVPSPSRIQAFPRKFCVHHAGRLVIIDNNRIQLFYAKDRLVFIQTDDGKAYPIRSTLSELEEKLDSNQFTRCHRNYIVNIDQVEYLNNWFNRGYIIILKGSAKTEVPVSRMFVKRLKKYIEFE